MKKVFTLISLLMALFVGNSYAQRGWEFVSENSVSEIIEGEEHFYALRAGYNNKGASDNKFFSTEANRREMINTSCVYQFFSVGEKVDGDKTHKIYVMKSVANGKYLTNAKEKYTTNIEKAYRFTAQIGACNRGQDVYNSDWTYYSNFLNFQEDLDAGAWVLCHPEKMEYIGFYYNPSFMNYTTTNHWYIYELAERPMTEQEKLDETFTKYFKNKDVNPNLYPVGDLAGCVDQAMYDELLAVYTEADGMLQIADLEPSEYARVNQAIKDVFAKYEANKKKLVPGYYLWINRGQNSMCYEYGREIRTDKDKLEPAKWDAAAAKNIWRVYQSENGKYILQNWNSERFVGNAGHNISDMKFPLEADSTEHFTMKSLEGLWHLMDDEHGHRVNRTGAGYLRHWNSTSHFCQFKFVPVHPDTIAKLTADVEQGHINKRLAGIVKDAKGTFFGLQSKSGLTWDGNYNSEAHGLVTKIEANSIDKTNKNYPEKALDDNLGSFFHSNWNHTEGDREDYHWMQMDLGKEVSEIVIKFSDRGDAPHKNMPKELAIVAAPEGSAFALDEKWTDTIANNIKTIASYSTNYPQNGTKDSTTFVGQVKLDKPAQHIRVVVKQTIANNHRPLKPTPGKGVTYNISEFRIYDAADCVENPLYTLVPEDIKAALNAAIQKADAELAAKKGTEATCEEVTAALEAFLAAYPDPTELKNALENAMNLKNVSEEEKADAEFATDNIGYFKAGAIEAFGTAITALQEEVDSKILTLEEIKAAFAKLEEAKKAFYAQLIVPEAGKVYRIYSATGLDKDGNERAQHNCLIRTLNADINGTPTWGYKMDKDPNTDNRFNALWLLEKSEEGYSFKNLANGYYMNNVFNGLTEEEMEEVSDEDRRIGYSKTPKYFTFAPHYEAGTIKIALKDGAYMNCNPNGTMVRYFAAEDNNAKFKFVEATDDNVAAYAIDTKAGAKQIITLPIEVSSVFGNNGGAMKVLGVKDGKIRLAAYADDETIPAGTPFVVSTQKADPETEGSVDENFVTALMVCGDLAEAQALTYNYEIINQNGMISTPSPVKLPVGFGYIYNNKVLVSEGGETISAGAGYFGKGLEETAEEGDEFIELTGTITGVENVEIVENNIVDVYTISGVKVRSNVKRANATDKLPKGVYVVGNDKVIVK